MSDSKLLNKSYNEQSIEDLQKDVLLWDEVLQASLEELLFYKNLLSANIFEQDIPNMFEKLQMFQSKLEELHTDKIDLTLAVRHHKNDLSGMMECEDIGCDTFYRSWHKKLSNWMIEDSEKFEELKFRIIRYSTPLLKQLN
ncbi:hypothetical protein L1I30_13600 [Gillisia sp. M10.2A]|uniref:Uncharacterized protein n=1 Tax=Gillisia lutea TaxID=2909668 RepID=A0ABS9EIM2_9FLAO|nr:hypothetical protein [Gillisia lutea]MCF4102707.1 hypothetical protein [Gillisia lutea]